MGLLDGPLDPSTDQARDWLRSVLDTPPYQHSDLIARVARWILHLISGAPTGSAAVTPPIVPSLVLAVIVIAVLAVVLPRIRRERRIRAHRRHAVLDDATSAADYRRGARAALDRGDFDGALLDAFRAIARSAGDRTLLDDAPARTAHEVGQALAMPFPGYADRVTSLAATFDAVCYGDQHADQAAARGALALDAELGRTRPIHRHDTAELEPVRR